MNSFIIITVGTAALITGTATAFADLDVVDHSGQTSALSIRDQTAVNACADAFLAKIAPSSIVNSHMLVPPGTRSLLSPSQPNIALEVTMEARTAGHALLARASCEVNYQAKVKHLFTRVLQPAMLAGLTSKDIRLGLVSRL